MAKKKSAKKPKLATHKVARRSGAKKLRKPARKVAAKSVRKAPRKVARKKVRLTELLDRSLLEIAAKQYARVLKEVAKSRKKLDRCLDEEKRIAIQLGERIMAKAREVVKETLLATK